SSALANPVKWWVGAGWPRSCAERRHLVLGGARGQAVRDELPPVEAHPTFQETVRPTTRFRWRGGPSWFSVPDPDPPAKHRNQGPAVCLQIGRFHILSRMKNGRSADRPA